MPNKSTSVTCVEQMNLATDVDNRVALATVRIGEVLIRGIAVWRTRQGRLRVLFPSYRLGSGWDEAICLPEEVRSEVEADVISAYKSAKADAKSAGDTPQSKS
jgi:hypothetical protein